MQLIITIEKLYHALCILALFMSSDNIKTMIKITTGTTTTTTS